MDMEKLDHAYTAGEKAKCCSYSGNQLSIKKKKHKQATMTKESMKLPYDPETALLGIYPRKNCILMSTQKPARDCL